MTTATADPGVSLGKQMNDGDPTHGHLRSNADAKDTRSFEDTTSREPLPVDPMTLFDDANLDKLNADPKEIERMLGVAYGDKSLEGDATNAGLPAHQLDEQSADEPVSSDSPQASAPAAAAPATPPADASTPPVGSTDQGEVIATRDGKGTIPYAVLAAERRRVAELERRLAEAAKPAASATPEAAAAAGADDGEDDGDADSDEAELLSQLRAEYPEKLVNVLERALERATSAEQRIAAYENAQRAVKQQNVTDVIDADPVLSQWRDAEDASTFDVAIEIDDQLRKDPRWRDKPMAERFETVKKMTALRVGIELPASSAAPNPSVPAPAGSSKPAVPNLEAAAAAVLAQAASKSRGRPLSHSDLPAGTAPAQSEQEAAGNLSVHQLAAMLDGAKDLGAIETLLARIA